MKKNFGVEGSGLGFPSYYQYCNNMMTECSASYSSEQCTQDFKKNFVVSAISLNGFRDLNKVSASINHVFEIRTAEVSIDNSNDLFFECW